MERGRIEIEGRRKGRKEGWRGRDSNSSRGRRERQTDRETK